MEDNKELVTDVTENVEEQATEELVDGANTPTDTEVVEDTPEVEETFTKAQLTEKIDSAVKRREAKLRRDFRKTEEDLRSIEAVLNAGLGTSNLEEARAKLTDFYKSKNVPIPERPVYSEREIEVLGNSEADEIISLGYDDVVEEVNKLADKGLNNMTPKERVVFTKLAEHRRHQERVKELASIGVKEDVLSSTDFQNYASQFKESVPIKTVYEMWSKTQPKPEVEQIGSMKNLAPSKVKDYYTPEEARRLTSKDLDNPEVMAAVEKSMQIWYEKGI